MSDQTQLHWARLTIAADQLDDAERLRIATENRLRSLEDVKGLEESPEAESLREQLSVLTQVEKIAVKETQKALRSHPLSEWCKGTIGVGEKQLARLLGVIGDPTMRVGEDEKLTPTLVSQLWSYCGFAVNDGKAPTRQRGAKINWNANARMRVWLIANSCIKQAHSPYRKVYDDARAKYADATHKQECIRCGPSGKPAAVDSPLSDGHKHARAIRLVAKEFLKDLWVEANRINAANSSD